MLADASTTPMKQAGSKDGVAARVRRFTLWAALASWAALIAMVWYVAPDWRYAPEVTAPLTRKLLFFHPASAWTSFAAYFIVFALSIAYLNERDLRHDTRARAAAEVGFLFNTIALVTGTLWGMQEWARTGENALATVYTEPKVLVVLVTWFAFAAYLLVRTFIDGSDARARMAAVAGVIGFLGVPLSYATSRLLQTSLHPDVIGPGKNPDATLGAASGLVLAWSALAFLLLFVHLWLQRLRLLQLTEQLEATA
jgi:heme exporter protein C